MNGFQNYNVITYDFSALEYKMHACMEDSYEDKFTQQSSKQLNLKHCNKCGHCCASTPCRFSNKLEVKVLAESLNMSISEFVKKYLVCICTDQISFYVRPIRQGEEYLAGEVVPKDEGYSLNPCSFLYFDNKGLAGCKINEQKPAEAKNYFCNKSKHIKDESLIWTRKELEEIGFDTSNLDNDEFIEHILFNIL